MIRISRIGNGIEVREPRTDFVGVLPTYRVDDGEAKVASCFACHDAAKRLAVKQGGGGAEKLRAKYAGYLCKTCKNTRAIFIERACVMKGSDQNGGVWKKLISEILASGGVIWFMVNGEFII